MNHMATRTAFAAGARSAPRLWWETRLCLALVVIATTVPLLYPPIPPLVDLLGHIGRYRVELDLDRSPLLQRFYDFHWAPISNLGVDVLILPLASLLGLEPAVKLIVVAIPPLTAIGMLWAAREAHGRVPPTAFFALPFIYGCPFLFGFVNFALSAALAFLAFALWLRLGRLGRTRLRSWIFAPIALILFYCHAYGLGMLGLMCFASEVASQHDRGRSWLQALGDAVQQVSVMALPVAAAMIATGPSRIHGHFASGWFVWGRKWTDLTSVVRDRWWSFDVATVEIAAVILLFAAIRLGFSKKLAFPALALAVAYIVLPQFLFDSAYADVRLLPYLIALALLAIEPVETADFRRGQLLAVLGLAFLVVRLGATTASLAIAGNDQSANLAALKLMPRGARVVSFYGTPTSQPWALERDSHLGGLVIARLEGFSNDQFIAGAYNLLELKYRDAGDFGSDLSEVVRPNGRKYPNARTIDEALANVPRDKFDYIWLINAPPFDRKLTRDLQPVWIGPGTILYRIPH